MTKEQLNAQAIRESGGDPAVFGYFFNNASYTWERALYISALGNTQRTEFDDLFESMTDKYLVNSKDYKKLVDMIGSYHASYIARALDGLTRKTTTVTNYIDTYIQEIERK